MLRSRDLSATAGLAGWGRRVVVLALVWALVASLVVLAPAPAAAAPGGCDADGDGVAGGTVETVLSDGRDDAAAALEADTGVVLAEPQAAHRWRVEVCAEPGGGEPGGAGEAVVRSVLGAAVQELAPEAAAWEAEALDDALEELAPQYWRPGARTSPHVEGVQVVGIEMWLAVDPAIWQPLTVSASAGEVSVSTTATPQVMMWEFSDGITRVCQGPGVQYTPGAPGPAPCGRDFEHTTEVVPVALSVSIDYALAWTSTLGGAGTTTVRGEANRYELVVGEVQTYLSDGQGPAPPPPEALADPPSSRPADDADCGWSSPWDCSASEFVEVVVDTAGDILLSEAAREALAQVWAFLQGCASFVGDAISSIGHLATQVGELVADPSGFMSEKFELVRDLSEAIKADSEAFIGEFLADTLELDLMKEDPARWAGKIGCEVAVAVFTGGAGSARIAKILSDTDKLRAWTRRHDNGDDGDDGVPEACRTSSFPTGTLVAAADGTRAAIETIEAGDLVLAFDPASATWAPRAVSAAWSYLDSDEMATLVLADGSVVSATDHHRFYDAGEGTFVEAEDLSPGDRLATPQGLVSVAAVHTWPSAPTLVWELSVEVDHTFAVYAGEHAVAVHNQDGCDGPSDPRSATPADDLVADGRQVHGPFPRTGGADEVLVRRGADGRVSHYQVYGPDGLPLRRVDINGRAHGGVPTPHVVDFERHTNPDTGELFVRPGHAVRPARPEELPSDG